MHIWTIQPFSIYGLFKKEPIEFRPFPSLTPNGFLCKTTVVQNNQEFRVQNWATRSSIHSFASATHSFACSTLLALLMRSTALTSLIPLLVRKRMIWWLFFRCFCFQFWTIVITASLDRFAWCTFMKGKTWLLESMRIWPPGLSDWFVLICFLFLFMSNQSSWWNDFQQDWVVSRGFICISNHLSVEKFWPIGHHWVLESISCDKNYLACWKWFDCFPVHIKISDIMRWLWLLIPRVP